MRTCSYCKTEKPLDAFTPAMQTEKYPWCRECRAEWRRKRKEKFPDEQRAAKARYKEKHYDRYLESKRKQYHRDPEKSRAKLRERYATPEMRAYRWAYQDRRKWLTMMATYGITRDDWDRMWNEQDGRCAVCRKELTYGLVRASDRATPGVVQAHIDHCHETGKVRGLLCSRCNQGIGLLADSTENLMRAIGYLSRGIDYRPSVQEHLDLGMPTPTRPPLVRRGKRKDAPKPPTE